MRSVLVPQELIQIVDLERGLFVNSEFRGALELDIPHVKCRPSTLFRHI